MSLRSRADGLRSFDVIAAGEFVCTGCLEKEPARRYPTPQQLAEDLARFENDEPIAARPVTRSEKFGRWCRRRPAVAELLAALAISLLAGLSAVLGQWRRAEEHAQTETRQRHHLEEVLTHKEIQEAEGLFAAGDAPSSLARLARVLHQDPTNHVGRLVCCPHSPIARILGRAFRRIGDFANVTRSADAQRAIQPGWTASRDCGCRQDRAHLGRGVWPGIGGTVAARGACPVGRVQPRGSKAATSGLIRLRLKTVFLDFDGGTLRNGILNLVEGSPLSLGKDGGALEQTTVNGNLVLDSGGALITPQSP